MDQRSPKSETPTQDRDRFGTNSGMGKKSNSTSQLSATGNLSKSLSIPLPVIFFDLQLKKIQQFGPKCSAKFNLDEKKNFVSDDEKVEFFFFLKKKIFRKDVLKISQLSQTQKKRSKKANGLWQEG